MVKSGRDTCDVCHRPQIVTYAFGPWDRQRVGPCCIRLGLEFHDSLSVDAVVTAAKRTARRDAFLEHVNRHNGVTVPTCDWCLP